MRRETMDSRFSALDSEKAQARVVLRQAERIHDARGGETVRGSPLHRLGRGRGGRILNHGGTVRVRRVIVRVRDVERLGQCVLGRPIGFPLFKNPALGVHMAVGLFEFARVVGAGEVPGEAAVVAGCVCGMASNCRTRGEAAITRLPDRSASPADACRKCRSSEKTAVCFVLTLLGRAVAMDCVRDALMLCMLTN